MKKTNPTLLVLLFLLALSPLAVLAQSTAYPPERVAFQGFAADGNGAALATNAPKNYDIIFRIWNDPTLAAATNRLWTEQQTVTVDKGYFSVLLGEGSPYASEPHPTLSGLFASANASDRYVEMTVRFIGTGGSNVTILPRLRLLSSPYAFLARSAGKLTSSSGTDLVISSGGGIAVNGPIVGSINGSNLTAGSVSSTQLAANSVTSAAIAPGAVGSSEIAAGAVGSAQIAANAITSAQIADGAVGAAEIADGAVGAAEIANGSITGVELAPNLVLAGLESTADLKIDGASVLEMGAGVAGKEVSAGKIGYGTFTPGFLDIVGAGTNATSRKIKFWAEGGAVFSTSVGIGTLTPGVPLDVVGQTFVTMADDGYNSDQYTQTGSNPVLDTINDTSGAGRGIMFAGGGGYNHFAPGESFRAPLSIRAQGWIASAKGFAGYSDRRIKRDLQPSVTAKDLATIQKLQVTDYRMVDPADGGRVWREGFIAQEVEEVIPEAVKRSVEFIPDVFSLATNAVYDSNAKTLAVSLTKDHGLQAGDRVRLHLDGARMDLNVSALPSAHEFVVEKCDRAPQKVFVYGREVSDFRTLDYNRIFTSGIGAIQELAKKVVAQGAELDELRAELIKLRSEKKTLAQSVSNLEARDQAREARLARLELMLEKGRMEATVKGESRERAGELSTLAK